MAFDFFGVRLAARIIQYPDGPSGKENIIDLWTKPATTREKFDFSALSFVSQVNMELTMGDNAKLSIVLTPPFEDGLKFLQSDLVRFGVGRLEVEIGYSTGTTDTGATQFQTLPFAGFLQKPDVSIGQDITITLHALGVGYAMNTVGGAAPKSFQPDQSPADCVEAVLKKYVNGKLTGLNIKDLYANVTSEQRANDSFFQPVGVRPESEKKKPQAPDRAVRLEQGPRNDWWFIRETIENHGYDLFIQGNKALITKKTDFANRKRGFGEGGVRKHFKLRGNVDPALNMFPILSFQSPTEGVWMENGIGKQSAKDIKDDKSGQSEFEASVLNTTMTWLKEKFGLDPESKLFGSDPSDASANMPVNPDSPLGKAKVRAAWRNQMMSKGIQGEFSTIGVPNLRPGEVVQVTGFEPIGAPETEKALFNGPYGVINVRHSVGVGGFTTNFLGVMNFFPRAFREAAKAAKGDEVKSEELGSTDLLGDRVSVSSIA